MYRKWSVYLAIVRPVNPQVLGTSYFCAHWFLSLFAHLCLHSTVSLSHCILAVLMLRYWEKHLCTSSAFSIAILNGTCCLCSAITEYFYERCAVELNTKLTGKLSWIWHIFPFASDILEGDKRSAILINIVIFRKIYFNLFKINIDLIVIPILIEMVSPS